MRTFFFFFVLGLASCAGYATEYFVAVDGSDKNNDGLSKASAFATVQRGLDALEPGDTLTILPGEYLGTARREGLGSDQAVTTIRAAIPGTAVLRGDIPVDGFRAVDGYRFVYVADFPGERDIQAVIETDTLRILNDQPNIGQLEFTPGVFYQDRDADKLYLSSPDLTPPPTRRYTAAINTDHGLFLSGARRVVIEGLALTGFHTNREVHRRDGTGGALWALFLQDCTDCVVRDSRAWLNAQGFGMNSQREEAGGNTIADSIAWANRSPYGATDRGGFTIHGHRAGRQDVIRDCLAYLNQDYGVNIYTTSGTCENNPEIRNRLIGNTAWGHPMSDIKIKTGHAHVHTVERSVGAGLWSVVPENVTQSVIGISAREYSPDSISFPAVVDLDPDMEFADPENHDYRLQSTSRFRGAGPDGADAGPHRFAADVYFVKADGNDGHDGLSMATAWQSPARALRSLEPGDTLYLAPGSYAGDIDWQVPDASVHPIVIKARGRDPVLIEGALRVQGGAGVRFDRIDFNGAVTITGTREAVFHNGIFVAGLDAAGADGLRITHGEFPRRGLQLADSRNVFLSGSRFDLTRAPAVTLADVTQVLYADYNAYRSGAAAWLVGGEMVALDALRPRHERYAQIIRSQHGVTAAGPHGAPHGRNVIRALEAPELRLIGPLVHSVSSTTANIEWWASAPTDVHIAWGRGSEVGEPETIWAHRAGNFSLTGLDPDTDYTVSLALDHPFLPLTAVGEPEGQFQDTATLTFRTAFADPPARDYYVTIDGDDAADGLSRETAWRTVSQSADRVRPGDTVWIGGGVYAESVRLRATGEADRPIRFTALPGEKVVFDGLERSLTFAFLAVDKSYLQFDGFYFTGFATNGVAVPWADDVRSANGAFVFYRGRDIGVMRCFYDARGPGYGPGLVHARHTRDLSIINCVIIASMGGGISLAGCPDARVEHTVFLRNLISNLGVVNEPGQPVKVRHSIFTENLASKVLQPFVTIGKIESLVEDNNVYNLRVADAERQLFLFYEPEPAYGRAARFYRIADTFNEPSVITERTRLSLADYQEHYNPDSSSLVLDPLFHGALEWERVDDDGREIYLADRLVAKGDLDFPDLFATHPEVVARGIGLQPEAFSDFHFTHANGWDRDQPQVSGSPE